MTRLHRTRSSGNSPATSVLVSEASRPGGVSGCLPRYPDGLIPAVSDPCCWPPPAGAPRGKVSLPDGGSGPQDWSLRRGWGVRRAEARHGWHFSALLPSLNVCPVPAGPQPSACPHWCTAGSGGFSVAPGQPRQSVTGCAPSSSCSQPSLLPLPSQLGWAALPTGRLHACQELTLQKPPWTAAAIFYIKTKVSRNSKKN